MGESGSASRSVPDDNVPHGGRYRETRPAPKTVEVAATLLCVNGGLALLGGVYLLAAYSLNWLGLLIALAVLAVAVAQIRAGVLVRQMVPWGRTGGILLSALAVLLHLPLGHRGLAGFVVAFALGAATVYLLYHRDTLRVFPPSGRPLRL